MKSEHAPEQNWAGNHVYTAERLVRATSVAQAQEAVAAARHVRALGTRHSFNALCDTEGTLLDLTGLVEEPVLDEERRTVRVTGGTSFAVLARFLEDRGLALANMGSLPHISVAGAAATGTHGSGTGNAVLAASVSRLELLAPDGSLRVLARGDAGFDGAVVSLGAAGVVTRVDLDVQPTYQVAQELYDHLGWDEVVADIDPILSSAYSVSVFTMWRDDAATEVLVKHRVGADPAAALDWARGTPALAAGAPFTLLADEANLTQRGEPGPWFERLPHFRADRPPSWGEEIQTEWFVDRADASAALRAVTPVMKDLASLLTVTEVRAIRSDDLWLSPASGRETVALHFTWARESGPVLEAAKAIEAALAPYAARPHWGKVFDVDAFDASAHYPRLPDFVDLIGSLDPEGKFRSPFVDRLLGLP